MPALVDTSAWIEFFHAKGKAAVKRALAAALEDGAVVTAAPVLTELLMGLEHGRAADVRARDLLKALEMVDLSWDVCSLAGDFGRILSRRGQRAPTADLIIAAAAASGGHDVWHIGDTHFAAIERAGGPHQRDLND